ncbi:MAG: hypothetical protein QOC96_3045 [Acidobacteriota bacterium]|jgi:hypothetical protein|nr:hypothetical protein [Acidobacteriota bacterium]
MKRIRKLALIFFFIAPTLYPLGQGTVKSWTCPEQKGPMLERKVCNPNIELNSTTIDRLVMTAFSSTGAPGGVSLSINSGKDILYTFKPASMDLRDMLDSIVEAAPDYEWKENNGVINLHPINDYLVLNTTVAEFDVEKATKGDLLVALKESPEFKRALAENGLSEFPLFVGGGLSAPPNLSGAKPPPPKVYSAHLNNVTVREILNEIVRLNGRSTWLYQEFNSDLFERNKRYYRLYFLVDHSN